MYSFNYLFLWQKSVFYYLIWGLISGEISFIVNFLPFETISLENSIIFLSRNFPRILFLKGSTIKCTGHGFDPSHSDNPKKHSFNLFNPSIFSIISSTFFFWFFLYWWLLLRSFFNICFYITVNLKLIVLEFVLNF